MPASGVYPWNPVLRDVLLDSDLYALTSSMIFAEVLIRPLQTIYADAARGLNSFICRERYRQWVELTYDATDCWIGLPSWDELRQDPDGLMYAYEQLDTMEADWEVFFNDHVPMQAILDRLTPETFTFDAFLETALNLTLMEEAVFILCLGFETFYVLRSSAIGTRGRLSGTQGRDLELTHVDDIAAGLDWGPIDTYVIPQKYVDEWRKAEDDPMKRVAF